MEQTHFTQYRRQLPRFSAFNMELLKEIGSRWNELCQYCSSILLDVSFEEPVTPEDYSSKTETAARDPGHAAWSVDFNLPIVYLDPSEAVSPERDSPELNATFEWLDQREVAYIASLEAIPSPRPGFIKLNREIFVDYRTSNTEYWKLQQKLLLYHRREGMNIGVESDAFPRSDSPKEYWIKQKARMEWHYTQFMAIVASKRRMDAEMAVLEVRKPLENLGTMPMETRTESVDAEAAPAYEACVPYHA